MKTDKNKIEFFKLFSMENLLKAEIKARKGKGYRKEISRFNADLIGNLRHIQDKIFNGTYKFGPYKEFILYDSKKRLIITSP